MTAGALDARGIVLRHEGLVAVDHVDVRAEPGRITAVIGPNGAGKTSLFDCLSGVQPAEAGTVLLDGVDITRLSADERSRRGLLRTFQRSSVFSSLTVAENLRVGAENRRRQGTLRGLLGLTDRDEARLATIVERVLDELGLGPLRHVPAGQLPTGTLRLVELGRALCADPVTLLLDEPASGLGDLEIDRLRDLLTRLAGAGLALLLVEHDIALVQEAADTVYAMAAGRIVGVGPPSEIVARPEVRSLVLGMAP